MLDVRYGWVCGASVVDTFGPWNGRDTFFGETMRIQRRRHLTAQYGP